MNPRPTPTTSALLALAAAIATPAWGANECKVEYGYFTGSGPSRQDHTQTVTMNAGQTLGVNRSSMNFVRNTGTNKVDVTLTGALSNKFTLDKNQRNPGAGPYLTPVTLVSLLCTHGATAAAPSTPEQLVNQLKQANASAAQIAQQLKSTFNQTGQQVANLLKLAGYGTTQVAAALASTFNATGAQAANWLQAAGYTGEQVAAALKAQFNASAAQAATWLKAEFNATGAQVAAWLQAAGYAGDLVAAALMAQFNASAAQAAAWLKAEFNATGAQVAAWLQAAGYAGDQVAAALKAQFNATAAQAAAWLKSAFNATTPQLAQWLRNAGYTLVQVAQALEQLDIDPAQAMAAARQAFGASWTELVNAYRTLIAVLQPTNCGAAGCNQGAQLLKLAGAKAEEALKALKDVYNLSESAARQIAQTVFGLTGSALEQTLVAAGYAAQQFAGAVRQAADSTVRTVQNPSTAGLVIDCVTWPDRICNAPDTRRPPVLEIPVRYGSNALQFKVFGKNLQGVNGISGLPARQVNVSPSFGLINASAQLNQSGANWTGPTSGTGQLTVGGQPVAGGTFAWRFVIDRTAPVALPPPQPLIVGCPPGTRRVNNQCQ